MSNERCKYLVQDIQADDVATMFAPRSLLDPPRRARMNAIQMPWKGTVNNPNETNREFDAISSALPAIGNISRVCPVDPLFGLRDEFGAVDNNC
jgi:hypothetical protein